MKKSYFALSMILLAICILTTKSVSANEISQTENYFTEDDIVNWEQTILNNANNEYPIGDTKGNNGRVYRAASGAWTWRDGVICITDSKAITPLFNNGHAGIIAAAPYYYATIEANPRDGVQPKYGNWNDRFSTNMVYQYGVKRTSVTQDQNAAKWAARQIGKQYNYQFFNINRRDKFYCSQLVWAAYRDTAKVDIGTWEWGSAIHPFELMSSNETTLIYQNK